MKLRLPGTVKRLNVEHRTSNPVGGLVSPFYHISPLKAGRKGSSLLCVSGNDVDREWDEMAPEFHKECESLAVEAEEIVRRSISIADKARWEGMD
jgi:hypothetical protein